MRHNPGVEFRPHELPRKAALSDRPNTLIGTSTLQIKRNAGSMTHKSCVQLGFHRK